MAGGLILCPSGSTLGESSSARQASRVSHTNDTLGTEVSVFLARVKPSALPCRRPGRCLTRKSNCASVIACLASVAFVLFDYCRYCNAALSQIKVKARPAK